MCESTIYFRHILEKHELGEGLFEEIKGYLESRGLTGLGRETLR